MSDLKKAAVVRAINTLASVGATYTVVFEGETVSNAPEAAKKPRKTYTRSGIDYKPMYMPAVDHLSSVSDYFELACPPDIDIEALRSALSSTLFHRFGAGKTATSVNKAKGIIEIVKV